MEISSRAQGNSEMSDVKSCLCAQSSSGSPAEPRGHLRATPAPCRPCCKHSWRQSHLQHICLSICQHGGLWTSHNIHLRACCDTYDILRVFSVLLRTHDWGFADPFWEIRPLWAQHCTGRWPRFCFALFFWSGTSRSSRPLRSTLKTAKLFLWKSKLSLFLMKEMLLNSIVWASLPHIWQGGHTSKYERKNLKIV